MFIFIPVIWLALWHTYAVLTVLWRVSRKHCCKCLDIFYYNSKIENQYNADLIRRLCHSNIRGYNLKITWLYFQIWKYQRKTNSIYVQAMSAKINH